MPRSHFDNQRGKAAGTRKSEMSSLLFWALVGIVCLSPLPLASNRPLPWSLLSLAVGILLLVWGAGRLYEALRPGRADTGGILAARTTAARRVDGRAALFVIGFAILAGWYWVQASPSPSAAWSHAAWAEAAAALGETLPASISLDPAAGRTLLMKIIAYGGIFLLALVLGRGRGRARMAFWAVSIAGFGYAVYGLAVHFAQSGTVLWFAKDAYPDSVTSTFVNRNAYATYAGIAVIAGLALLLSAVRRLRPERLTPLRLFATISDQAPPSLYFIVAATAVGMVAIVLTGSRAGLACVVLGLFVFAVGMLIARDIRLRTFAIGMVLVGSAMAAVLSMSGGFLAKRLTSDTAPEARAVVFDVAWSAATAHPWTGQGLGGFGPAFNRANDGRALFETYIDLAHNSYLELAVEGGIPALALSLLLLAAGVGICFAGVLAHHRSASTSIAAVAIAVMVGAHASVDFGMQMPAVAATFMLLIGVAAGQALAEEPAGSVQRVDRESRAGSQRRRRFGDRPHSADEAVTPPHDLETPWPVRSPVAALPARQLPAPATVVNDPPDVMTPSSPGHTDASANDYQAALARWRALRQSTAGDDDATSDPVVSLRPPMAGDRATASDPDSATQPQPPIGPMPARPARSPASGSTAASPAAQHDPDARMPASPAPPGGAPAEPSGAAGKPQPPTPPAWPGAVAPRRRPLDIAHDDPADGEDRPRGPKIVDLPRTPRS